MRKGNNPNKDILLERSEYTHQVVMPVHIPNIEGYFEDSLQILKLSISSLLKTSHNRTYISIVNNGSCDIVVKYLDDLYHEGWIHELIHTQNIGKLNAILKGLAGNNIELVTIADADVLFLKKWQIETITIFKKIPKVGVVGIVPQFNMYKYHCGNIIWDNLFSKKLKFIPIKNKEGLIRFYKSIGWDDTYNKDLLEYGLGLDFNGERVYVGSGHFVATYKKQMFENMTSYLGYKLGGGSESYLDESTLKYDYWRVTTYNNYAYHLGNTYEDWMSDIKFEEIKESDVFSGYETRKPLLPFLFFVKNRAFQSFLFKKSVSKIFYKMKGLPLKMIKNYNKLRG